jgi:hypothetical protein
VPLTRDFVESSIVEDYADALGPDGAGRSDNPIVDASPRAYLNGALLDALWTLGLDAADRTAVSDADLAALDDTQARQYILAAKIALVNKMLPALRFQLYNQSSRNSKWDLQKIMDGLVDDLKSMKVDYIMVSSEVSTGLSASASGMAAGMPEPAPWAGRAR